jgi:16S rRNA (guanine527-N7)-methyltransferase
MNRISDAPLPPVAAGAAPTTDAFSTDNDWPGLAAAATGIGTPLDSLALDRFARYRDLLSERSARFNLTAIREPDAIERRLFLDALAMLPVIDATLGRAGTPMHSGSRLIDVGSGAGFPGLALKIARPELDVTLVDATGKKVAFLQEVIAALDLDAARAIQGRAEELGQDRAFRERFDLATARAVATLPALLELVTPLLDVGGFAFLPKGMAITDELRSGKRAARKLGVEMLPTAESLTGDTRIVIARKTTLTPKAYPRRAGLPVHSPLGQGA